MKAKILVTITALAAGTAAFSYQDALVDAEPLLPAQFDTIAVSALTADAPVGGTRWVRPEGPLRVALQAGHWKAAEAPDEQAGLRGNGTRGGGKAEWEVNLEIAEKTAAILRERGYLVEILPTTIPPDFWSDVFVAIHADGNPSTSVSGYRVAAPRRDATGRAGEFAEILEERYGEATGIRLYPELTRRMQGYYAFNYRRYQHALHPMTVGVIIETGFLTNPNDRRIIVNAQDKAAKGIAEGITLFLETMPLEPQVIPPPYPERQSRGRDFRTDR